MQYFVYILANGRNGTLYIGITDNLVRRIYEHKNNLVQGFTSKYSIHDLVYHESHADVNEAILREKRLKKWNRGWKIKLIEQDNRSWSDLYSKIV